MRKIIKKSTIILLVIASMLMVCFGLISLNKKNVLADEPEVISVDKASVYIDDAGIRYLVTIDKTEFEGLTNTDEIGAYLAPTANLGSNELNKDSYVKTGKFELEDFTINGDDRYQAYFYVYGIPAVNNGDDISVRAYIKKGENYTLSTTKSCSIAKVAYDAAQIDAENAETILTRYCIGYLKVDYTVNYKCNSETVKTETKQGVLGQSSISAGKFAVNGKVYSYAETTITALTAGENNVEVACTEVPVISENEGVYTVLNREDVVDGTYYNIINNTPSKAFEVEATFKPNGFGTENDISGTGMSFAVKQGEHYINFLMVTDTGLYCVVDGADYGNKEGWNAVKVPGAKNAKIIATTNPVTLKMTYDSATGFKFFSKSGENWVAMSNSVTLEQINTLCGVDYFNSANGVECGIATRIGQGGAYGNMLSYGGTVTNYTYSQTAEYTVKYMLDSNEIKRETVKSAVGSPIVVASSYQENGIVYRVDKTNLPNVEIGTSEYEVSYVKNFAVAELVWREKVQVEAGTGKIVSGTGTYYTTMRYLKVNAGDKITFGSGTATIIATYSLADKSVIDSVWTDTPGVASKTFGQDCYVRFSVRFAGAGGTAAFTLEQAMANVTFDVSADNTLVDVDKTEFAWKDNYQLTADKGALLHNDTYYVTVKYIKVNKGDIIKFTNNSALIIATYALDGKSITNGGNAYIGTPGATYYKQFDEDCYVRIAVKKQGNATTMQNAIDCLTCYITASDYADDGNSIDSGISWLTNSVVSASTGILDSSDKYYTTNTYIKVKNGDALFFENGTSIIIAGYSLDNKSLLSDQTFISGQDKKNPVYLATPANPQMFLFTQDCYVMFSIRIAPSGQDTATLTLEQARDTVTYAITAAQD